MWCNYPFTQNICSCRGLSAVGRSRGQGGPTAPALAVAERMDWYDGEAPAVLALADALQVKQKK
jgi:hypothetical protein